MSTPTVSEPPRAPRPPPPPGGWPRGPSAGPAHQVHHGDHEDGSHHGQQEPVVNDRDEGRARAIEAVCGTVTAIVSAASTRPSRSAGVRRWISVSAPTLTQTMHRPSSAI